MCEIWRATMPIWKVKDNTANAQAIAALSAELKLSQAVTTVLFNRGITTYEQSLDYFGYNRTHHDPMQMRDMEVAVARIKKALQNNEKVVIFGDYDADGVTSTALLYKYFRPLLPQLEYYIPCRNAEGYGLNEKAIRLFAEQGITLIITVDNGIRAHDEVALACELGIDVIITDHHQCDDMLPNAVAVVNPERTDCLYPFKHLAGVGVAFALACAYQMSLEPELSHTDITENLLTRYGDLVALGTIADVVPIIGTNRDWIRRGLEIMSTSPNLGIAALMEATSLKGEVTSTNVAFTLAPRINAAGRMESAHAALQLLLSETPFSAAKNAAHLCELNSKRQREEQSITKQASQQHETTRTDDTAIVFVADKGWNAGIIGIVAAKLSEKYALPATVMSIQDGEVKGSARSVPGLNIAEALAHCSDLLLKYGGHEQAAGFSLLEQNLPAFRDKLNSYICGLAGQAIESELEIDYLLSPVETSMNTATQIAQLEPFGQSNPQPLFLSRNLQVVEVVSLSSGKHAKLNLLCGKSSVTALYFGVNSASLGLLPYDKIDLVHTLEINEFNNRKSLQLLVRDLKPSKSTQKRIQNELTAYHSEQIDPPTREQFTAAYKALRFTLETQGNQVCLRTLSREIFADFIDAYARLRTILDIFAEVGVMTISENNADTFSIHINHTNGKVDLDSSSILAKLKNTTEQNR